uniref:Uncharacterized protein n=1 Tax=viral metagenome TaxID=1070528 RepID=A0A6C0KDN6_9ZZZZ
MGARPAWVRVGASGPTCTKKEFYIGACKSPVHTAKTSARKLLSEARFEARVPILRSAR